MLLLKTPGGISFIWLLTKYLREVFHDFSSNYTHIGRWLNGNNLKNLPGDLFFQLVKLQCL